MRKLFGIMLLVGIAGCNGTPGPEPTPTPTPVPTPTPTPTPPTEPPVGMLLRTQGPNLVTLEGDPVDLFGVIPCCRGTVAATSTEAREARRPAPLVVGQETVSTGWPIALAQPWRDYTRDQVGDDRPLFFHGRLGPFFGSIAAEPEWADVGGGHAINSEGLADLSQFNPHFWARVYDWAKDTCFEGSYVEFDLIDRWWAKQTVLPNPMRSEWNVQGYNMAGHVGRTTIAPGSFEDLWLEQAVKVLGPLPCVIWEDGNEVGLGPYTPEWTFSMRDRIRHHENTVGKGVVHLFSTNSGKTDTEAGPVDYIERHQRSPIPAPIFGKPSFVNEYNPRTPYTPEQMRSRFCLAKRSGTGWWYWRHTQTQAQMEETLGLFAEGCDLPPPPVCTLGTPTASEALAQGLQPTFKVGTSGRGLSTTPFAKFGREYCAAAGWTDGRSSCAVAPDGHPQRRACEIQYVGSQCPRWKGDCTGVGNECPITFDILIGDDPHPMNANAGCPNPHPNHQENPEVFWGRPSGKGYVYACNHDYTVCGKYRRIVDQAKDCPETFIDRAGRIRLSGTSEMIILDAEPCDCYRGEEWDACPVPEDES